MIKLDDLKVGSILVYNGTSAKCKVLGVLGLVAFLSAHGDYKVSGDFLTIEEINKDYTLEGPRLPKDGDVIVIRAKGKTFMRVATGNVDGDGCVRYYTPFEFPGVGGNSDNWEFYEPDGGR